MIVNHDNKSLANKKQLITNKITKKDDHNFLIKPKILDYHKYKKTSIEIKIRKFLTGPLGRTESRSVDGFYRITASQ